jgi:succinate dehydrogenase / fumarate reductase, flavoprotein subunit
MSDTDIERLSYDVVVIGAGGSGLRAAIEARQAGKKTAVISKSLFGKAHTVMAEGGCAAAMGNVNPNDNWQVHFRDTMRGGKFLNNWRMAELHAMEAPERVWELEAWGALFDRTKDGKISQRNFGGHEYPRLSTATPRRCSRFSRRPRSPACCWTAARWPGRSAMSAGAVTSCCSRPQR